MAYNTFTLTGTFKTTGGSADPVTVTVIPSVPLLVDGATGGAILSGQVSQTAANGVVSITGLPTTGADILPASDWGYTVLVNTEHGQQQTRTIATPPASGATLDIKDLTSTPAPVAMSDTAVGLSSLDSLVAAKVADSASLSSAALADAYVEQGEAAVNVEKQAGATFAARLQAAHDALDLLTDGGTIFVPAGTYALTAGVTLSSPVVIRGAGRSATTITVNDAHITAAASNVTFEDVTFSAASDQWLLANQTSQADLSGWVFSRCRFVKVGMRLTSCGRALGDGTTEATGTRVGTGTVIRDCEFTGYTGNETIFVGGTVGVLIDGCHIHDCGTDVNSGEGIKILHAATGTRVTNCLIESPTRDGIDAYNSIDTTIANCVIRDPGVNGIEIKWTSTETFNTRRTIVQGNRVERSGSAAYNLDAPDTVVVGNVALEAVGAGFRFSTNADGGGTATAHGLFIGNMALDGDGDGFVGSLATQAVFVGNGAFGNGGTGFNLTGPQTLIGNSANGNTTAQYNTSNGHNNASFWGNEGALASPYRVANNVPVMGYKADGNLYDLIKVTSGGALNIGSTVAGAPPISFLSPSGGNFTFWARMLPATTNTYDFGSASLRWKDLYQAGFCDLAELAADPAAPAANSARLYAKDNGAGKTQLCVRFATGAVQVIATEP